MDGEGQVPIANDSSKEFWSAHLTINGVVEERSHTAEVIIKARQRSESGGERSHTTYAPVIKEVVSGSSYSVTIRD